MQLSNIFKKKKNEKVINYFICSDIKLIGYYKIKLVSGYNFLNELNLKMTC